MVDEVIFTRLRVEEKDEAVKMAEHNRFDFEFARRGEDGDFERVKLAIFTHRFPFGTIFGFLRWPWLFLFCRMFDKYRNNNLPWEDTQSA